MSKSAFMIVPRLNVSHVQRSSVLVVVPHRLDLYVNCDGPDLVGMVKTVEYTYLFGHRPECLTFLLRLKYL